jgi:hypothetical protein
MPSPHPPQQVPVGLRLLIVDDALPHVDRVIGKLPKLRDLRSALAQISEPVIEAGQSGSSAPNQ